MDGIINEKELFKYLNKSKNVLLIEPPYIRQYKPLGLAKIASYIKSKGGNVVYSRGIIPGKFDLICITTLFTTDSKIVLKTIKECRQSLFLRNTPIIVGGIFASLMPKYIYEKIKVMIFKGYSKKLDKCIPDYSIDWKVKEPWSNSMICFTTRGCPNKCGYCMVWKMEPDFYIQPNWKKSITENKFEIALISDNNFLSAPISHIEKVVKTLIDNKKKVIFNNAIDVRLMTKEKAKLISKLKYTRNGLRFAFDRMEDDGYYQKAMEMMIETGFKIKGNSYTYILFNFNDTPKEAYYRAKESWKYGSNPYLMKYRPLDLVKKKNNFIGKYWTPNLLSAFNHYGITYGYNRGDKTFESWATKYEGKWSYKSELTKEDWEVWNYER